MNANILAGEIGWRGTEFGLLAGLGLKIMRSEVAASGAAERLGTLATVLRHWSTTAKAIFARARAMLSFGASEKRLMRFAPTVPISRREDRM
jgi:hypothetical protein